MQVDLLCGHHAQVFLIKVSTISYDLKSMSHSNNPGIQISLRSLRLHSGGNKHGRVQTAIKRNRVVVQWVHTKGICNR